MTNANYFQILDKTRSDRATRMGNVLRWAGGNEVHEAAQQFTRPLLSRGIIPQGYLQPG